MDLDSIIKEDILKRSILRSKMMESEKKQIGKAYGGKKIEVNGTENQKLESRIGFKSIIAHQK